MDSVEDHESWSKDIAETQGHAVNYPLIGDTNLEVAKLYDMLHPNARGEAKETLIFLTKLMRKHLNCFTSSR